jgi:hypothetical protein
MPTPIAVRLDPADIAVLPPNSSALLTETDDDAPIDESPDLTLSPEAERPDDDDSAEAALISQDDSDDRVDVAASAA